MTVLSEVAMVPTTAIHNGPTTPRESHIQMIVPTEVEKVLSEVIRYDIAIRIC